MIDIVFVGSLFPHPLRDAASKVTGLVEVAYWDGAKDGAVLSAIVLILLYLLTHDDK